MNYQKSCRECPPCKENSLLEFYRCCVPMGFAWFTASFAVLARNRGPRNKKRRPSGGDIGVISVGNREKPDRSPWDLPIRVVRRPRLG